MNAADLARSKSFQCQHGPDARKRRVRACCIAARRTGKRRTKCPRLRLRTIEDAGRLRIAFTTGILIGIGETREERVDSLLAIREMHARYGHIQEVIVQNFRAKPATRMALHAEPIWTICCERWPWRGLILGGEMNLQAPPNLSAPDYTRLLDAGINDWGGISPVTPDFINPEAAWPHIRYARRADC